LFKALYSFCCFVIYKEEKMQENFIKFDEESIIHEIRRRVLDWCTVLSLNRSVISKTPGQSLGDFLWD